MEQPQKLEKQKQVKLFQQFSKTAFTIFFPIWGMLEI